MADEDTSLAAHTPSKEYLYQHAQRRVLQLLGANAKLVDTMAPLPYESKYPMSNKLMDAILTLSLDPVVKPLSLKGDLPKVPMLRALSKKLADKGYFRRYPGGGIGIGSGPGGGGEGDAAADTGPDAPPSEPIGTPPQGDPPMGDPDDPAGMGNPKGTNADLAAAARASGFNLGGFLGTGPGSMLGTLANMAANLGGLAGFGPAGMVGGMTLNAALAQAQALANATGRSLGDSMAALSAAGVAAGGTGGAMGSQGTTGQGGDGGGGVLLPGLMTPMVVGGGGGGGSPTTPGSNVSAGTRANAAARVGGGISPQFLEALESIRGQS